MNSFHGNHDDVIKWIFYALVALLWGDWWIPLPKASEVDLWRFLWSAPEQTIEKTTQTLVIWDAIAFIMTSI